MKSYSPKAYVLTLGGRVINEGLAPDGDAIKVSRPGAVATTIEGIDGETVRSQSHKRLRKVELRLLASSAINSVLSAMLRSYEAGTGSGVASMSLTASITDARIEGLAYITDEPDVMIGAEVGVATWKFDLVEGAASHAGYVSTAVSA